MVLCREYGITCVTYDKGNFLSFTDSEDNDSPLFNNDNVAVVITARGGHIGHLEGLWPLRSKLTYLHRLFVQYFSAMFQNDSYKQFLSTGDELT